MKEYKYLYRKMLDRNVIRAAYKKLRKGKTKRNEIKYIDAHLEQEVEKMREMILNTRPCNVEHPEKAFRPPEHQPKIIHEHGKDRIIYMPDIYEQWLHHIIVQILEPIVRATAYPYSCGSFPNRGAHYGKERLVKWIHSEKNLRYFAKLDIRHFYNNIRHDVLKRELEIRIKDEWFIHIIMLCLSSFDKGVPLGFYISQWLANYFLEPLDKAIMENHKVYMRYMDDMVIFGGNKKELHKEVEKIKMLLGQRFRLRLKDNYQVSKFIYKGKGRCLDYMGFKFYREKTTMRKSIMISAVRLARKLYKAKASGRGYYYLWIYAMISYMGWFSNTDTYACYWHNIKPMVDIGKLKTIISRRDRHESMEKRTLQQTTVGASADIDRTVHAAQKHPSGTP